MSAGLLSVATSVSVPFGATSTMSTESTPPTSWNTWRSVYQPLVVTSFAFGMSVVIGDWVAPFDAPIWRPAPFERTWKPKSRRCVPLTLLTATVYWKPELGAQLASR